MSATRETPRLRVLVVDDELVLGRAVRRALIARGHAGELVSSAEEALARPPADVVVTDLRLPGADGLELVEALRARGDLAPVVVVGGLPTLEDCRHALRLGVRDLLAKPFAMDELVRAVERAAPAIDDRAHASAGTADDAGARRALDLLHGFLAARALPPSVRARALAACSELTDNACRHAYADGHARPGPLRVEASVDGGELLVAVDDEGRGFDPLEAALDVGTGGLARAAALSEDLRVASRRDGGTRVELRFTAAGARFDGDDSCDLSEHDWLSPSLSRRLLADARAGAAGRYVNLPPALAVSIGRLLCGVPAERRARAALWT